jgi:aerobic carbon-monoxide dehydrogenase medium subunit
MIPASFEYKRATSVAEAISMLKADDNAKILAGGHSLIPAMKLRLAQPSSLIDIAKISELNFIRDRGKYIAIGAATTHGNIASHKTTTTKVPLMAAAANAIGDVQVRNRGTIGGSIAHADPAADWPAILIAADATIKTEGAHGEKKIPADEFFTGFFSTALDEGEIITEIHVPEPDATTSRYNYAKFVQPASRFAIVGCAVQMSVDDHNIISAVRVAFNGVADHAYRAHGVEKALTGNVLSAETIAAAAEHAVDGVDSIMEDHYASATYRSHLAKVYCRRALEGCMSGC